MRRLEVIANQSVQEEMIESLQAALPGFQYTVVTPVQGAGRRSQKRGDVVWPELNFILIAYMEAGEAEKARTVIAALKARFPDEGISFFELGD
jgi:nitrogen regulatory protein PII